MAKNEIKDMTTGRPISLLTKFFIPLLMGNLFQQFYSMVDSIIVGKFVGVNALAGVGATGAFNFLILGFAMGICGGFGIMFGQRFGARDYKGMRNYIANSLYLTVAVAGILTPITMIFCRQILLLMQTPVEILEEAYSYIIVILAGILVTMLYNIAAAILRAIGDSKTPLYALIGASLINIALDLLFVLVFHMGTFGVGVATVIAQGISGLFCFLYMFRKYEILKFHEGEYRADRLKMVHLMGLGIPMALQFSITAIGSVMIQTAVNGLGAIAVAAVAAGSKVSMIFSGVFEMIGMAMATYSSQNKGAREYERIKQGVKAGFIMAAIGCVVTITVVQLLGRQIALLFIDSGEVEIMDKIVLYLRFNSFAYPCLGTLLVLRSTLQGIGYSFIAMLAGVSELLGRGLVAFFMVGSLGFFGVCMANPAAWIFADIILVISYIYGIKKLNIEEKQWKAMSIT